jgi:hypothetical protein
MQFDIYNPAPGREDEFLSSHPEFAGRSVRLHGVLSKRGDRRDFVSTSDLTGIQELALFAPLGVQAGDTARFTLRLDLARVFLTADRAALIDPATAAPGRPLVTLALHSSWGCEEIAMGYQGAAPGPGRHGPSPEVRVQWHNPVPLSVKLCPATGRNCQLYEEAASVSFSTPKVVPLNTWLLAIAV